MCACSLQLRAGSFSSSLFWLQCKSGSTPNLAAQQRTASSCSQGSSSPLRSAAILRAMRSLRQWFLTAQNLQMTTFAWSGLRHLYDVLVIVCMTSCAGGSTRVAGMPKLCIATLQR